MKKILITGGAGFIGSHLSQTLLEQGNQVTIVDDESTGSFENLANIRNHENLKIIQGSIADKKLVSELLDDVQQVYHLAAAVGVALVAKQPVETIERNIEPTQFLLSEINRRVKSGQDMTIFVASTSEVYGKNPKSVWTEEDDLVFGPTTKARWSYGASKAIDEFLALGYWRQDGLPVVIGRFFNVVGPRQTGAYGMVLPRFVDAAIGGKTIRVHDDGKQIRCFAHVSDVIYAVIELTNSESAQGKIFNIGSDEPVSILELAELVKSRANSEAKIEFQSYSDAYDKDFEDIRRRVPCLDRLKATIEYTPKYDLKGIVDDVIESRRT